MAGPLKKELFLRLPLLIGVNIVGKAMVASPPLPPPVFIDHEKRRGRNRANTFNVNSFSFVYMK